MGQNHHERKTSPHPCQVELAQFYVGAVRCTLLGNREITMRLPANIYPGIRFGCVRLSVSRHPRIRIRADVSVERNCPWSAEIESSWIGNRCPRAARTNRCCGSSRQSAPSAVERRWRCPPVCSVSRKLVERKRVYVRVATHGASRPRVSRAVSGRNVTLRR